MQLDLQFYDDELNPVLHKINFDISLAQQDGHQTQNGYDRFILYVPFDESSTSGDVSYLSEIMHYPVGGQHKVFAEAIIIGVGTTEPFPEEFNIVISHTFNNDNPITLDFRP